MLFCYYVMSHVMCSVLQLAHAVPSEVKMTVPYVYQPKYLKTKFQFNGIAFIFPTKRIS